MTDSWPRPSPPAAFFARRRRFLEAHPGAALFVSGLRRPRNFPHNLYAHRAESHFLYFVGGPLEGAALLFRDGSATLYARPPEPEMTLWTGPAPSLTDLGRDLEIEVRPIDELEVDASVAVLPPQDAETASWLQDELGRPVEAGGGDVVEGIDASLADVMIELRLRHDDAAVDQLRQAAAVTALAHRAGMGATRPGVREAVVRAAMEERIVASGMSCSYGSIVTTHGEVLHNETHHHLVNDGDLVLADVGAETPEGWAGDVTRTWPASGRFSGSQRALYEAVLASQRAALDTVVPGARYLDVHRAAGHALVEALVALGILGGDVDDLYARGAAALFFPHGVGHLLGLDVHDMEDLGDRAGYAEGRSRGTSRGDRYLRLDRDLEPGMAVTIEPGFYRIDPILSDAEAVGDLEGSIDRKALEAHADVRGIRIEDDVLVTATGSEVLTSDIPKTIEAVEACVASGGSAAG